jgi:hypothetical protein
MSWTRSNPLSGDVDGDGILDSQEKIYGFNPHVPNDSTALLYETALREWQAPLLLTRFEERAGAASFADSSGSTAGNVAGCAADTCPIAGVQGRFGNAAYFNGTDQYLTIPPNEAMGRPQAYLTASAWIKPTKLSGTQTVVQIGPGGPNGAGGVAFGLSDANLFVRFEGGGGTFVKSLPAGLIPLNQWTHIGVEVWGNLLYMYVNGVDMGAENSIHKQISTNPYVIIGAAQRPATDTPPADKSIVPLVQIEHFAGAIDEVLIQDWVPVDYSSIEAIFAGRYNLADLILRPGQEVAVDSSLENALLARRISGQRQINYPPQLTHTPSVLSPFVLEPTQRATYDDSFMVAGGAPSGVYTLTQSVDASISIPAEDVWVNPASNQIFGWSGPQNYAGASYTTSGNQQINLNSRSFTMAGWVRPTHTNDAQRRGILGRNSGQNDAYPYLVTEGRQLRFGFGTGNNKVEVTANNGGNTNVLNLNQWNFIAVRYNLTGGSVTFFVNGVKLNSVATNATPNSSFDKFFIGRASNRGQVNLTKFDLICEGDGLGDGEYDIIGIGASGVENLTRLEGTEPRTWNFNITRTFNETYQMMVCEDDNNVNTDCASNDELMGILIFNSNNPSSAAGVAKLANPAGATGCSYDWGMAGWPDVAELTYSYTTDSIPFTGEIRGLEIHGAALSDQQITNINSRGVVVADFPFNEVNGSAAFSDETGFHQLACNQAAGICPSGGRTGTLLTALGFDGVDDHLVQPSALAPAQTILGDLAGDNEGYTIKFWLKPDPPADASKVHPIYTVYDTNNLIRMQLAIVHTDGGYKIQLIDNYELRFTSACGVRPYGEWELYSVQAWTTQTRLRLGLDEFLCDHDLSRVPAMPLATDRLVIGDDIYFPHANNFAPYQGVIDGFRILRRPMTSDSELVAFQRATFPHIEGFGNPNGWNRPLAKGIIGQAIHFAPDNSAPESLNHLTAYANRFSFQRFFTFGFWVKADQSNTSWHPILTYQDQSSGALKQIIGLLAGRPFIFQYQDGGATLAATSNQKIAQGAWQHLLFRVNYLGANTGSEMSIFINGQPVILTQSGATTVPWDNRVVPSFTPDVKLGTYSLPGLITPFVGRMDEFTFFAGTTMSDKEVREFYNAQNAMVDETIQSPVTVDADRPTSTLELPEGSYLPNRDQTLAVTTQDLTSRVFHVEFGVDRGNGIRWSGAEREEGDRTGNTWIPLFTPDGEGAYTLYTRATDSVGNQSTAIPIVIALDTTAPAPQVTYLNSPGPQARADSSAFPAILSGDSLIGGIVSEQPSDVPAQEQVAGVDFVEVTFEPLFTHGSPFRNQKLPTGARLYLPLDESSRADSPDISFADVSPAGQLPLICAGEICPQAGAAGKMAQALAFDGVDDSLTLTNTASINGLINDFTVGAWIKPSQLPWVGRIVSTARTQSNNGWGLGTFGNKLLMTTYGVKDYISSGDWLMPGVWQHVAMYMTADNAVEFYVNGQLVETIPGAAPAVLDSDDRLLIGATTEIGDSATSQHFPGLIDEVVIMQGRPIAVDWEILLGADPPCT